MAERPLRLCELCGELDDHPRHVIDMPASIDNVTNIVLPAGTPTEAAAQLLNDRAQIHHHNCGASAGCEVCAAVVGVVGDKTTGSKLLEKIQGGALAALDLSGLTPGVDRG